MQPVEPSYQTSLVTVTAAEQSGDIKNIIMDILSVVLKRQIWKCGMGAASPTSASH